MDVNLNNEDIDSSNSKTSWRTLIEFPADKVACAIFVQETLCSMIQQKLVNTSEEIDEAMVKLYEMLGSNDEMKGASQNDSNSVLTNLVSDKDSVISTCGTIIQFDGVDDEIIFQSKSSSCEKCCQVSFDIPSYVQNGENIWSSPFEHLLRRGIEIINNENLLNTGPSPSMCYRANGYSENILFRSRLNLCSPCVFMNDEPRNLVMVVEESEESELALINRSESPSFNSLDKLGITDKSYETISDYNDSINLSRRKKSNKSNKPRMKKYNFYKDSEIECRSDRKKNNQFHRNGNCNPSDKSQCHTSKNRKLKNATRVSAESQLILLQSPPNMDMKSGVFALFHTIYNIFLTLMEVTKSIYYRLL